MIFENFLVLGRTVPEKSKKYGEKICMAGVDLELNQLLRIYPLPIKNEFKAGHVYRVSTVDARPKDPRHESWKINIGQKPRKTGEYLTPKKRIEILKNVVAPKTILQANTEKKSLAAIFTDCIQLKMKIRNEIIDPAQLQLFESFYLQETQQIKTANNFRKAPYINFNDGTNHCLQLREWGVYELLRKKDATGAELTANLKLNDRRNFCIIAGNMAKHRNTWLAISIISERFERQNQLFSQL